MSADSVEEGTPLPTGSNCFFRQLDYVVATLANDEFKALYELRDEHVAAYAELKDAIFSRCGRRRSHARARGGGGGSRGVVVVVLRWWRWS